MIAGEDTKAKRLGSLGVRGRAYWPPAKPHPLPQTAGSRVRLVSLSHTHEWTAEWTVKKVSLGGSGAWGVPWDYTWSPDPCSLALPLLSSSWLSGREGLIHHTLPPGCSTSPQTHGKGPSGSWAESLESVSQVNHFCLGREAFVPAIGQQTSKVERPP